MWKAFANLSKNPREETLKDNCVKGKIIALSLILLTDRGSRKCKKEFKAKLILLKEE